MAGLAQKIFRDKPGICAICGKPEARYVLCTLCDVCNVIEYLKFRHAMNWPLDDLDKKRLGLM